MPLIKKKYNIIPIYISKQGRWYTGDNLLDIRNYRDMKKVIEDAEEVFMRPEYGDYNLYKVNTGMFSKRNPVVAELHVVIPVLHGTNGEDGIFFEGLLETIGIPFAGCNTLSSQRYGQDHHEDDSSRMRRAGSGLCVVYRPSVAFVKR